MASKSPDNPWCVAWGCRCLVIVVLMLACGCAQAAVRMQVASLTLPGAHLTGVAAVAWTDPDGRMQLRVRVAAVSVPALGWDDVSLTIAGAPQRAGAAGWKLVGHVSARDAPGGALADAAVTIRYAPDSGTLAVHLSEGKSSVRAYMPIDQISHLQLSLASLPLDWLRGVLAAVWPQGRLKSGAVTGSVALDLRRGATRVSGRIGLAGVDLDSQSGKIALRGLDAAGSFRVAQGSPATQVMFDGRLHGGQMLLGPLYARLPSHQVDLHVQGTLGAGEIGIDSLDYDDHGALQVSGSLGFDHKGHLEQLDLGRIEANFPAAYTRYGTSLVENLTGLRKLKTSGRVTGSLHIDKGQFKEFDLTARHFSVTGARRGVAVTNLDGRINWQARTSRPATTLSWDALGMDKLLFGAGKVGLHDRHGALTLSAPVTASLFGGVFRLTRMLWRPDASKAQRLSAAFSISNVDLASLCKALGLPAFQGKLGGAVPDLRYRGDDLVFAGGLSLQVFGGAVSVTDLSVRHPFGTAPVAAADINFSRLNLAQLTHVFEFGRITGRLHGSIHDLRLVNWKPVAFVARLSADSGGKISQNAIKSLTEVGGGGISGGIQSLALRLFKDFGYSEIGISCTLAHGVCTMGGITPDPRPDDHGFTIVKGSGLPHITVIGHQRAVDWATLVSRLEAATQGKGPVVK